MEIPCESHKRRDAMTQSEFISTYQIARDFANILEIDSSTWINESLTY